ncbi:6-phosphofructokinase [Mogibacterium sp. NSJ-24]|jgi:6-phosphofructokinase 1|uniref:ATP-dependent 6-phosphofructokinase n=1 Tax=Lentihominibacter hominis TaxID=2763645 RepID=A0A926EAY4_9FIRM|nr:6-phosphofructokinase [Lentihominibacter hominis]MBC8568661.1 6-phosphofructokinase [Lentihominibacter hominis]
MKRIGILTSGGDAPGMNAAVRSAVRTGISMGMEVYGIKRGYEGLLDGEIERMQWQSVGDILQRGGTILRTARSERFRTEEGRKHGVNILETFGIEGLVVIGGDGSFRGGSELAALGITVMGVPGTIDNDLAYTDYTIGFDTAVNTVLSMISNLRDTASAHERTTIVEVMGRECGDIALYSGLAGGADVILLPEMEFDINSVCRRVLRGQQSGKLHSIIVKAEGVEISSHQLAETVQERTGREARAVVPGYIQRGGTPTGRDRMLASMMAARAIKLLYDDEESKAIGTCNDEIIAYDLEEALSMKKHFRADLYEIAETLA